MKRASPDFYDFIVIGAGIVGLAIARALQARHPDAGLLILDKEARLGLHASGRNSGVLHSGIYYPHGSLKGRLCAAGGRAMGAYCDQRGVPIRRVGKVIVPTRVGDDAQLDLLHARAHKNGARTELIDERQLREIEPEARSASGRALYAPDAAVIDPRAALEQIAAELRAGGATLRLNCAATGADPERSLLHAAAGALRYGRLFNAAGQCADRVARLFGAGRRYALLPFKGRYWRLKERRDFRINGLIYPVPDLNVPFLGVHSVTTVAGATWFGPTALPAWGREHYRGVAGIEPLEAARIAWRLARQYLRNRQGFRRFAHAEAGRLFKSRFLRAAQALTPRLRADDLRPSDKVGIRAQLLDCQTGELAMDFLVERQENVVHLLNAVSPGFTSAFSFADFVVENRGEEPRMNTDANG